MCGASRNTAFEQFSLTNYTYSLLFKKPDWFANNNKDDSEDEDGTNGDASAAAAAHHVLLLLDCAASMFAPVHPDPEFPDERLSSVQFALQTVQDTVRRKIRQVTVHKSGKRDGLGVLLYNTKYRAPLPSEEDEEEEEKDAKKESTNNHEDAEDDDDDDDDAVEGMGTAATRMSTVHTLLPLKPPGVQAVKKLRATQPDLFSDEVELDLQKEYGNDDRDGNNSNTTDDEDETTVPLREALYVAQKHLTDAACFKEDDHAEIWIVTATDMPHSLTSNDSGSGGILQVLQTAVADLRDRGMQVVVWPVVPPASSSKGDEDEDAATTVKVKKWDASKFYDPIGIPTEEQDDESGELPWTASVLKKTRRSYRIPLLLPNWQQKGVTAESPMIYLDMYKLTQDLRIPLGVPIHNQTGKCVSYWNSD